ncbi:proliferating cell nuclear antigen (pcna) [Candidatus Woesearchaeota archaeon]|nr:MAG: proliferating cell nuclear antigen (pcna) [Candidatus Woesearchaeota archaeon]
MLEGGNMKLSLVDTKFFKEPVSIISDLVTESRFIITKEYVELVAMDPANVAMIIFKLFNTTFTEYAVDETEVIAINLSNLKQVLRRIKANDTLSLEVEDSQFKITLKSNSVRTFYLPIIDLEEKDQKVPDLQFKADITMPSSSLNDAIDDVDVVGESVSFIGDDKKFTISAAGDLNKATIELVPSTETKIAVKEKVKSKYSIEYLKKMIQGSKISDTVRIHFSKDYPLRLDYFVVDRVQLSFILAPRVEND